MLLKENTNYLFITCTLQYHNKPHCFNLNNTEISQILDTKTHNRCNRFDLSILCRKFNFVAFNWNTQATALNNNEIIIIYKSTGIN